jgi:hypothetical protein
MAVRNARAAAGDAGDRLYRRGAASRASACGLPAGELGYVEGKNFAAEYRLKPESLPQAAADLQSCLAAMQATGHPGWAALSAPGMRSLDLPKEVRNVIVFADVGHRLRGTEYINMWPSHSLVLDGGSPADRGHFMLRTRARRRSLPPRLLPSSARISYRQLRIVF